WRYADRVDYSGGVRALHRNLRPVVAALVRGRSGGLALAHPVEVLLPAARVDADEEPFGGEAVDDDVVDDAALFVAERRVLRLPVLALGQIVGDEALGGLERGRALQDHLAHVAHVEDAGPLADRGVLLENALVLHRHLESGEFDHAGARGQVSFVERGPARHRDPRRTAAKKRRSFISERPAIRTWERRHPRACYRLDQARGARAGRV